tara:strand:- start:150 stop:506 length:357 start_codon:yes stop_codon:yes gene_type:complete
MSIGLEEYDPIWSRREYLFNKIVKLLDVSKKNLKLIEDSFKDKPEVHANISDKIVNVSMFSLIKLMNNHPHELAHISGKRFMFSDYRYKYFELESFEMSSETKEKYIENLKILQENQK